MKTLSRYLLSLLLTLMPAFSASTISTTKGQGPTKQRATTVAQTEDTDEPEISEQAKRQIEALLAQKRSRTPEQEKMDPNLLVTVQQAQKAGTEQVPAVATNIQLDERRRALVDIRGNVTTDVLQKIEQVGGEVIFSSAPDQSIRARVPLRNLEEIAGMSDVTYIEAAVEAATHREGNRPLASSPANRRPPSGQSLNSVARLKAKLADALAVRGSSKMMVRQDQDTNAIVTGPPVSQGDRAHQADTVRDVFGFDGTGVRIGVLSDSVRFLAQSQASKNLPPDVTVIPGQGGSTTSGGEGTAMLEIVHDLAPGAKLFFATAFNSDASFANNIRRLRFEYRCDIIVDDVFYFNEHPFQDALIARAVNDVTADGALYFSSAGNEGNLNDGTSGVWEGDYVEGGSLTNLPESTSYKIHGYGDRLITNRIRSTSPYGYALFWADPWGRSNNDYDLFILDSTMSRVKGFSIGTQSGTQNPYEFISPANIVAGDRIVIANYRGAQPRALHLNAMRGQLAINSRGQTRGHSSAAGAFSVAAVNAATANGGAFVGGNSNPVETFSADGPRRIFFNPDGTSIVPGNFLFATNGGTLRDKPDIAAADGVSTSVPVSGLSTFFGTSAAAPHAAAVAALLKSAAPTLTSAQIRSILTSTALDIGPLGWDRTAGIGIVTALGSYLAYAPSPLLQFRGVEILSVTGDSDRFVEPGETASLSVIFFNGGNAAATGLKIKLTALTPGVTVLADESDYFQIAAGKAGANLSPFRFRLAETVACGARLDFTANVSAAGVKPQTIKFSIQTGQPGSIARTTTYAGPPVSIPDGSATGVSVRLPISGLANNISKVSFRINGDNCGIATGAGLQHAFVGDLTLRLISPAGTVVTLMSAPGGNLNYGQNFCNTLLDDSATNSIQNITPALNYTGTFRPASPLAAFIGENANGNWTLQLIDSTQPDAGILRSFSILITTYDCVRGTSVVEVKATQ